MRTISVAVKKAGRGATSSHERQLFTSAEGFGHATASEARQANTKRKVESVPQPVHALQTKRIARAG